MKKELIEMEGGKAVLIDHALLAIIGAEDATALDLITDGTNLILRPLREGVGVSRAAAIVNSPSTFVPKAEIEVKAPETLKRTPELVRAGFDPWRPMDSVHLIRLLQAKYNFAQEHFQRLHHFERRSNLSTHIAYCTSTNKFRAVTNAIVAQRMLLCLQLLEQGESWDTAISEARSRLPFPAGREGY